MGVGREGHCWGARLVRPTINSSGGGTQSPKGYEAREAAM